MIAPRDNSAGASAVLFWILLAIAAACAFAAVWLNLKVATLEVEIQGLTTERDLADVSLRAAQTQLHQRSLVAEGMINDLGRQLRAHDPWTPLTVRVLTGDNHTSPFATVVWNSETRSALLVSEQFPPNPAADDYVVWVVRGSDAPAAVHHFHQATQGPIRESWTFPEGPPVARFFVTTQAHADEFASPGPVLAHEAGP